jgi:hypothetical protein
MGPGIEASIPPPCGGALKAAVSLFIRGTLDGESRESSISEFK